jgi:hypothetical protein
VGNATYRVSIYSHLTLYVDDATIETVCTAEKMVGQHVKAVNTFVLGVTDMRMQFSDTKNVTCASKLCLAREVNEQICNVTIKAVSRTTSLGTGLGAGTRRNMIQVRKRLRAFRNRVGKFKMLRRNRVRTDRLIRTGGLSALTFGQRSLGVADSLLLEQRRGVVAASCDTVAGANIDLSLAIADGKAIGAADPAFEAHVGVLLFWACAIWESWVPIKLLHTLVEEAVVRLGSTNRVWAAVCGPAAAMVASAWRLGWKVISATECENDLGESIDLKINSPSWVADQVKHSVVRWRWRRVELVFPMLASGNKGNGPAWRPVLSVLCVKESEHWGPAQKGALRSVICGRQWTQERVF